MGVRRVSGQDPGLDRKPSDMPMDTGNFCRSGPTGSALKHPCAQHDLLRQFKLCLELRRQRF
jgi:hypothetical protein